MSSFAFLFRLPPCLSKISIPLALTHAPICITTKGGGIIFIHVTGSIAIGASGGISANGAEGGAGGRGGDGAKAGGCLTGYGGGAGGGGGGG